MLSPSYRIYPSLLDSFQRFLNADKEFEGFFNEDPEGGYKRSLEDISAELEQRLLDGVNRVEREPMEAADKGTCFNEIVDFLTTGKEVREGMTLRRVESPEFGAYYEATLNGFTFQYGAGLCENTAEYFKHCIPQYLCKANLLTKYGVVELYGYADEIGEDKVYDIKTTKDYSFGKYEHGWQRYLYPFCLQESGELVPVSEFEFYAVKWMERKGQPLAGAFYKEAYTYDHETARRKLAQICERLVEWLEANRYRITDRKVFGE